MKKPRKPYTRRHKYCGTPWLEVQDDNRILLWNWAMSLKHAKTIHKFLGQAIAYLEAKD